MGQPLVFGVRNLKIRPVLTDPTGNAPMTYDTQVSVTGINNAQFSLESDLVEANGDDATLGAVANPGMPVLDFTLATIPIQAFAVLFGATYSCDATTASLVYDGTTYPGYFEAYFEAYTDDAKLFTVKVAKMKAATASMPFQYGGFADTSFQARGVLPKSAYTTEDTTTDNRTKLLTMTEDVS